MDTANGNAVTNPITRVEISAHGTAVAAFRASSARWTAPSIPAYMKLGLAMPVKNTTPSGQPVPPLVNDDHTTELGAFGDALARQAIQKVNMHSSVKAKPIS